MLDELKQNLIDASLNRDVQVVILSASGPVFSAGHNLKELVGLTPFERKIYVIHLADYGSFL